MAFVYLEQISRPLKSSLYRERDCTGKEKVIIETTDKKIVQMFGIKILYCSHPISTSVF